MSEQFTAGQTSSIGAVWPPQITTHNRLRGFYTDGVVRRYADVRRFAAAFDAQRLLAQALEGVDRLSIRVVAHAGALATLEQHGITVEAALPLTGVEPDLVIAYMAANQQSRTMSTEHLNAWRARLREATARPRGVSGEAYLRTRNLTPRLVTPHAASRLVPRFAPLYAAFGYNEADVYELLPIPPIRLRL